VRVSVANRIITALYPSWRIDCSVHACQKQITICEDYFGSGWFVRRQVLLTMNGLTYSSRG